MQTQTSKSQFFFKALLVIQTLALVVYTAYAFKNEGFTLFQIITANITALNWNGQFNLDFSCYLTLSGIWIMWRSKFSASSVVMALIAMIIGFMAFAPYLLYLIISANGNLKKVLLGEQ